jgi:hypothetical protein
MYKRVEYYCYDALVTLLQYGTHERREELSELNYTTDDRNIR